MNFFLLFGYCCCCCLVQKFCIFRFQFSSVEFVVCLLFVASLLSLCFQKKKQQKLLVKCFCIRLLFASFLVFWDVSLLVVVVFCKPPPPNHPVTFFHCKDITRSLQSLNFFPEGGGGGINIRANLLVKSIAKKIIHFFKLAEKVRFILWGIYFREILRKLIAKGN